MAEMSKGAGGRIVVELDRKVTAVFKGLLKGPVDRAKREKAEKDFRAVRDRIMEAPFGNILDTLFKDFSQPVEQRRQRNAEESLAVVREFRERAFVEAAALLFVNWRGMLASVGLDRVLQAAPDAACLEAWLKTAKVPPKEVERQLLAAPGAIYATAGADWLVVRAKPDQLFPLLELFLSRQARPSYLRTWEDALTAALKKDKRGILLDSMLRHPWPTEDRVAALAEAVRSNRSILRAAVEVLPGILAQNEAPVAAAAFAGELFRAVITTEGADREFVSGALARLGSGILVADRRGPQSEAVLLMLQDTARRLRNLTRDEALQARTWLLENLTHGEGTPDGKLHVTLEGARHLALAFEKAAQGFGAADILTVTARNLGLAPIGKKGDVVAYNPLQHQDMEGGLVPGDAAVVEEGGWAFNKDAVIRSKVMRTKGGSHV